MSSNKKYIGIDGCKDGWFCVFLGENDDWSYRVVPDARGLGEIVDQTNNVLIDIPIGLLNKGPDERLCDKAARKLLGPKRASSVFPAPSRQALDADNYQDALEINRTFTGRGLSQQAWAIVPKIREIDNLLTSRPRLHSVIRECHPELCFWALNDKFAMQFNKKKEEGKQERLLVLDSIFPQCRDLYKQASLQYLRRQVAHDDIIDAMVCAVTAKNGDINYTTVPTIPELDSHGLPMEMVYWINEHELAKSKEYDFEYETTISDKSIHITLVTVELFIPLAHSLKEKRSAVRSLKDQLRARFNASVAEIGYQDKWQRALIGVCMLSGDKHKLEVDVGQVRQFCEEAPRIEIVDIGQEWL